MRLVLVRSVVSSRSLRAVCALPSLGVSVTAAAAGNSKLATTYKQDLNQHFFRLFNFC